MRKLAILIYGAPGSGKGTQANLLAWKRDYFHFDSGRYLEAIIRDPANRKNKSIQEQKRLFDEGTLLSPAWVLRMTTKKAQEVGKAGVSIIFSGSPRTMFEAFGDKTHTGLIDVIKKNYGKKNIFIFFLKVKPETSISRNGARRVCSVCSTVVNTTTKSKHCPICHGLLRRRSLDNPKVILHRLVEYTSRTLPIITKLKEQKFNIATIDAEPLPEHVFKQILSKLPY